MLRYRINKHTTRFGDKNTSTLALLHITNLSDAILLEHCSKKLLREWYFESGLRNCGEMLNWLDLIASKIERREEISTNDITYVLRRKETFTLHSFLINSEKEYILPVDYWFMLGDSLARIDLAISGIERKEHYDYYIPKLNVLLLEVFTIQEGLLTAALNYD